MYNLAELYYPITAKPDGAGELKPCKELQPYIRCFWGSLSEPAEGAAQPDKLSGHQPAREIIIPDTCMDIIWEWDADTGASGGVFAESMIRPLKWSELNRLRPGCALPSGFTSGRCTCSRKSRSLM